jgi:hypothetical protein
MSGRRCEHDTGFCTDYAELGSKPLGAPCDPRASNDECAAGFCLPLSPTDTLGVCTAFCRTDVFPRCGWQSQNAPIAGICRPQLAEPGPLDPGLCRATCDCDDYCGHSWMVCVADPALEQYGKAGYCAPIDDGLPGTPCQ